MDERLKFVARLLYGEKLASASAPRAIKPASSRAIADDSLDEISPESISPGRRALQNGQHAFVVFD